MNPAKLLDEVEAFVGRFVAYPTDASRVAHVLWVAHTHLMPLWESTPRIAFVSAEPGSGKSRALEVTGSLVPRPVHAVNASPAYLFRKVADPDGLPTILFDEIDTVFGPKAKDNEEVRGLLNAGHRRGAVAGRCVIRGKEILTEELPAYAPVALAGLDDLPDTIRSRAVMVRMRRRGPGERVEPWRARLNEPEGHQLRDQLSTWTAGIKQFDWPSMPAGVEDRDADVWEALLAVAELAGGDWPQRARVSAVTVVTEAATHGRQTFGVLLLADLRRIFGHAAALRTNEVLDRLHELDESPWSALRGGAMTASDLARRLRNYTTFEGDPIGPKPLRIDGEVVKGYRRADLLDAWARYLPAESARPSPAEAVTPVTPDTPAPDKAIRVTDDRAAAVTPGTVTVTPHAAVTGNTPVTREATGVTTVTALPNGVRARCTICGQPMADLHDGATTHPNCGGEAA